MIRVTLVHCVFLSLKNGANTVMRALLSSTDQFSEQGIALRSLTPDKFSTRIIDKETICLKDKLRNIITETLITLSKRSRLAAAAIFYIREQRSAKIIAKRYIASENYKNDDVVFFHTLFPCYYFLKYRTSQKQKIVMVLHTNGETFKMSKIYYPALGKSRYYKKVLQMEEFTLQHADRINFVSKASRENFLQLHPDLDPKKVFYIYNGIENCPAIIRTHLHTPLEVVCVASISERKGQHYIVDALKTVDDSMRGKVHFTFVGDGISREQLERDVKDNGLEKYITFAGVTNKVEEYLKQSDIYILPSEDEGLPMAIIEAMRASLPIISTPVGGIPEMIDQESNGLLIEPTVESFSSLICRIDQFDWLKMGRNARKTFEERFLLEKMVEGYSEILRF